MENYTYKDLSINGDNILLDAALQPVAIYDRDVIAQDIRHALRESGLLEMLIGERNQVQRNLVFQKIKILVESDQRIEPGTAEIEQPGKEQLTISAATEFGPIYTGVTL